jgi:hypothetical protein
MNAARLIKHGPMLILVAFLAYAGYSIHASADDPGEDQAGQVKDVNAVQKEIITADNAEEGVQAGGLRDPFQVVVKPGPVASAHGSHEDDAPDSDLLAEIVRGLKLDATFLQGGDELAIIDGRIYSKGESLFINAKSGNALSPLVVVSVVPGWVTLRGGDKDYVLGYPDQPVLSQKTHTSPARPPAKSKVAHQAGISSPFSSAPRRHHSRGSLVGNP